MRVCDKFVRVVACIAAFAPGCGSDGDGAAASSGVERNKPLASLTDDDAKLLCEFERSIFQRNPPSLEQYCTYFSFDGSSASCRTYLEECLADDTYYRQDVEGDWGCPLSTIDEYIDEPSEGCTLTISDLEACIAEGTEAQLDAFKQDATCDTPDEWEEPELGPACKKLETCFDD